MTKQLATVPLIEGDVKARDEQRLQQLLAQQSILDSDRSNVERLGSEAGDVRLQGLLRPPLASDKAELLATELAELSQSAKAQVPLFRRDDDRSPGRFERAGYYSVEDATVGPAHPADQSVYELDVSLSEAGSRGSAYRAVRVNPQTRTSPFNSQSFFSPGEVVTVPSSAEKVQYVNEQTGEIEPAGTPDTRTDTAFPFEVAAYDLSASSFFVEETTLLYDVPYGDDVAGVRVYDSRGETDRLNSENVRQWQVAHSTDHVFDDEIIISNHLVRMRIEEPPSPSFTVESYNGQDEWTAENLGSTDWEVFDVDIVEIGQHRVAGQIVWYEPNDNITYPLFFKLGLHDIDTIFFARAPDESDPIPSGLENYIDSVSMNDDVDIQATRTLIPKSEVRR